jgi:Fe-S cluster assembly ATP-binding protein
MQNGKIITSGGKELAIELESRGYDFLDEKETAEVGS